MRPGGDNNPYGCKGKQGVGINVDNVNIDQKVYSSPDAAVHVEPTKKRESKTGNATDYTLRRITKKVQNLLAKADAQTTEGGEEEVRPGGVNNPLGLGGKSGKTMDDDGIVITTNGSIDKNIDNTEPAKKSRETIHGNTTDYTLRRITKAAKGIKSGGTKPTPELQAKCSTLLERIAAKEVTVNQAAIEAGFRKPPKRRPTTALEWLDVDNHKPYLKNQNVVMQRIVKNYAAASALP